MVGILYYFPFGSWPIFRCFCWLLVLGRVSLSPKSVGTNGTWKWWCIQQKGISPRPKWSIFNLQGCVFDAGNPSSWLSQHVSRDKEGCTPNVRVPMVFIVFNLGILGDENTHKYPLYRAYIGISHGGTLVGVHPTIYPLIFTYWLIETIPRPYKGWSWNTTVRGSLVSPPFLCIWQYLEAKWTYQHNPKRLKC